MELKRMVGTLLVLASLSSLPAFADSQLDSLNVSLKNSLLNDYNLIEGRIVRIGYEMCEFLVTQLGNCLGVNPSAPYLIPMYPLAPGEVVNPAYGDSLQHDVDGLTVHYFHKRKEDEITLHLVKMPTESAYFGYQSYVFAKQKEKSSILTELGWSLFQIADNDRIGVFNSVGDPLNNVTVGERLGGVVPWEKYVVFITASDRNVVADVKSQLKLAGFKASQFQVEVIGDGIDHFGHDLDADEFMHLFRYVFPEDEASAEAFRSNPTMYTYRITPKVQGSINRYAFPKLKPQSYGMDENSLEDQLINLNKRIRSGLFMFPNLAGSTKLVATQDLGIDTRVCYENESTCLGDTRDTDSYRVNLINLSLKDNEAILVTGVNHNLTNNASYVSLSVNDGDSLRPAEVHKDGEKFGAIGEVNAILGMKSARKQLSGTAASFAKAYRFKTSDLPDLNKFYAVVIARDCGRIPNCYEVTDEVWTGIEMDRKIRFLQRAYIRPGDSTAADRNKMLSPRYSSGRKKR